MTPVTADPKVRRLIDTFTTDLAQVIRTSVIETFNQTLSFVPKAVAAPPRKRRRRLAVLPAAKASKALPPVSEETAGKVTGFLVGRKEPIGIDELSTKINVKVPVLRVTLKHLVNGGTLTETLGGQTGRKILYATA